MKASENFKLIWWLILVLSLGSYLYQRYSKLIDGKPSYLDGIVFIVWIGISLAPLFQEMDLLGIKLKQKIDEMKKDVLHQLQIVKTEVKSIVVEASVNADEELDRIDKFF